MATVTDEFVCIDDFEKCALKLLCKQTADYYKSGANHEQTLKENCDAFLRLRFRPRFLRDVSERKLNLHVLGQPISVPIGVAPTAMHRLAHPDGEMATARAAAAAEIVMILSTHSTVSIEDVANSCSGLRWLQLCPYKHRDFTVQLIKRAEKCNYRALVLSIDTPVMGRKFTEHRNKFTLPPHLRIPNFDNFGEKSKLSMAKSNTWLDPSFSWKNVEWLRSVTDLPIVVKGVMTAEDAVLAVKHGVSGILVSNHGARQLDGVPATIEVLPEIIQAVKQQCEVYLDGGVRTGTDILKALALGAKMVFIGRPILWGLACNGENGAKRVLEILKEELDLAMTLSGCAYLSDIKPSLVVRQEYYSRL